MYFSYAKKLAFCIALLAGVFLLASMPDAKNQGRTDHVRSFAVSEALAQSAEQTEPPLRRILTISFTPNPSALVAPGEVTLLFSIVNNSEYDARNIYLISSDGLQSEPLGNIDAGDSQVFNRTYTVTQADLDAGEISVIISHDDNLRASEQVNYTVKAKIQKSVAAPMAEFTRQISSEHVLLGGTVTITYRVRNTGNVRLTQLRVSDAFGDFIVREDSLDVGETHVFTNRFAPSQSATSEPTLVYTVDAENEKDYPITLTGRKISIVEEQVSITFAADRESAAYGDNVLVTLMLRNLGDMGYRDVVVYDAVHGGVIASSLTLLSDGAPLIASKTYPVRGPAEYQFRIVLTSETGQKVSMLTEHISLPVAMPEGEAKLALLASTGTPLISKKGNVGFDIYLSASGGTGVRDVKLSEQSHGEIRSFELIPTGEATVYRVNYPVTEDAEFVFAAEWTDADGTHIVRSQPVQVGISGAGVIPDAGEASASGGLFSGESVRLGQSSSYAMMIIAAVAVLIALVLALMLTSRKERRERRSRRVSTKRREEMAKTARFTPVKRTAPKADE